MSLADRLDAALPQTQCTRCGFADCRAYAEAIASGDAAINRCPPGGAEGIERLATLSGRPTLPLDPECGLEAPRQRAVIDEARCIGCTLCIAACPVDCIVGAAKRMHGVIAKQCTGCELCIPACPVDCILLVPASGERTGWAAWSAEQAQAAAARYRRRQGRQAALSTTPPAEIEPESIDRPAWRWRPLRRLRPIYSGPPWRVPASEPPARPDPGRSKTLPSPAGHP